MANQDNEEFGFQDVFGDLEKFVSYEDIKSCNSYLNLAINEMDLYSKDLPEENLLKIRYDKLFEILNKTYSSLKDPKEKYLSNVQLDKGIPNKISKKTIEEACSELKKYSNQIEYDWFFNTLVSSDKSEMQKFAEKIKHYLDVFEKNIQELEYKENK